MKKTLIVIFTLFVLVFATGCNQDKIDTKNQNETSDKTKATAEPFLVSSENGDYKVTLEKLRITDKRNDDFKDEFQKVVFLDYTYENIGFGDDELSLVIEADAFELLDSNNNVLKAYPVSEENKIPQLISKGSKCSASSAYALNSDSKDLTISFLSAKGEKVFTKTLSLEK